MQNKDLKRCGQKQNKKILEQFQKGAQKGSKKKVRTKKKHKQIHIFFRKMVTKFKLKREKKSVGIRQNSNWLSKLV